MTNDDAIEILKNIQDYIEENMFLDRCAIDMAIEALKSQRPHGEWISCEDRLPEENGRFLVFLPDRNGTFMCADFLSGKWYPDDYECTSDHVIAWTHLPKPYKREGETE